MISNILHSSVAPTSVDLDDLVSKVVASLTKDAKSVTYASSLYNSDFFATESVETRSVLCAALANFFGPEFQNSYWNTHQAVSVT